MNTRESFLGIPRNIPLKAYRVLDKAATASQTLALDETLPNHEIHKNICSTESIICLIENLQQRGFLMLESQILALQNPQQMDFAYAFDLYITNHDG